MSKPVQKTTMTGGIFKLVRYQVTIPRRLQLRCKLH